MLGRVTYVLNDKLAKGQQSMIHHNGNLNPTTKEKKELGSLLH